MIIRRINARKVLGAFDYDISFSSDDEIGARLAVVYAENGYGKTNLLKAVKALLTLNPDSLEHLRKIPIENLSIEFRYDNFDSFYKNVIGEGRDIIGRIALHRNRFDDDEFSIELETGRDTYNTSVSGRDLDVDFLRILRDKDTDLYMLINIMRALNEKGSTLYIGDNRLSLRNDETDRDPRRIDSSKSRDEDVAGPMRHLLSRVERALNQASLVSYSRDSKESNVYARVAESVMKGSEETKNAGQAGSELRSELRDLIQAAEPMEKYELISTSQLKAISKIINNARSNDKHFTSLLPVLQPYFESMKKQIASLNSAQRLIDTYIETVNSFLNRKTMRYSSRSGIMMFDHQGSEINPDYLSSGEKHLLYLLSHALLAGSVGGILLIDEPEISLGISWQRKLLRALLECSGTEKNSVQFVVASHSLQVLSSEETVTIVTPEEVDHT